MSARKKWDMEKQIRGQMDAATGRRCTYGRTVGQYDSRMSGGEQSRRTIRHKVVVPRRGAQAGASRGRTGQPSGGKNGTRAAKPCERVKRGRRAGIRRKERGQKALISYARKPSGTGGLWGRALTQPLARRLVVGGVLFDEQETAAANSRGHAGGARPRKGVQN